MVRLLGNNLAKTKKISIALTSIFGIGLSTALKILFRAQINPDTKVSSLKDAEVSRLRMLLENGEYMIQGALKKEMHQNIKRLVEIGCYRGRRHVRGLPTRGQRTRTNSRTARKSTDSTKTLKK